MPRQTKAKAQRGMVTAAGMREGGRTVTPPVILRQEQPASAPPEQVYGYVTNAARFYQIKVVTLRGEDRATLRDKGGNGTPSEDEALTRAALAQLNDDYIVFHDYAFNTESRSVASWLDDRIRRGALLGVARDSAQMKVRCAYQDEDGKPCTFAVFNTKHGLEEMARHILEDHDTYEDDWQAAIPSNSPNDPFLPPLDDEEEPWSTADDAAEGEATP